MFCQKCGKQIEDGSEFCVFCGAEQEKMDIPVQNFQETTSTPISVSQQILVQQPPRVRKPISKKLIIGIVAGCIVAAAAGVGGWWFLNRAKTISLFDDTEAVTKLVKVSGVNGKGEVDGTYEDGAYYDSLQEYVLTKIAEAKGYSVDDLIGEEEDETSDEKLVALQEFTDTLTCGFDEESNGSLKNKDKIKYGCAYDADAAKAAKVDLKDTEFEYKVSGLKDVELLDVFKDVSVKWKLVNANSWTTPYYELKVVNDTENDVLKGFDYSVVESGNGIAKVSVTVDEEALNELGYGIDTSDETVKQDGDVYEKNFLVGTKPTYDGSTASSSSSSSSSSSNSNEVIGTYVVNVNKLNIRKSASKNSTSLGYTNAGDSGYVYEIKQGSKYTWYRIGTNRWIANYGNWVTYTPVS